MFSYRSPQILRAIKQSEHKYLKLKHRQDRAPETEVGARQAERGFSRATAPKTAAAAPVQMWQHLLKPTRHFHMKSSPGTKTQHPGSLGAQTPRVLSSPKPAPCGRRVRRQRSIPELGGPGAPLSQPWFYFFQAP